MARRLLLFFVMGFAHEEPPQASLPRPAASHQHQLDLIHRPQRPRRRPLTPDDVEVQDVLRTRGSFPVGPMDLAECRPQDGVGNCQRLVVMQVKLCERRELADLRRQGAQLVAEEGKPRQRRELADLRRQGAQLVAEEGKLCQRRELADLRRQGAQLVAAEVKLRQRRELADLRRQAPGRGRSNRAD